MSQVEKGNIPFRLYNSWLDNPDFIFLARTGLSKQIKVVGLFKVQEKLKMVKALAKEWAKAKGSSEE